MKNKPKTIELYVCEKCDQPIMPTKGKKPRGFIIRGNIYAAEKGRGGLVGNNFKEAEVAGELLKIENINENVFCAACLGQILGLGDYPEEDE